MPPPAATLESPPSLLCCTCLHPLLLAAWPTPASQPQRRARGRSCSVAPPTSPPMSAAPVSRVCLSLHMAVESGPSTQYDPRGSRVPAPRQATRNSGTSCAHRASRASWGCAERSPIALRICPFLCARAPGPAQWCHARAAPIAAPGANPVRDLGAIGLPRHHHHGGRPHVHDGTARLPAPLHPAPRAVSLPAAPPRRVHSHRSCN